MKLPALFLFTFMLHFISHVVWLQLLRSLLHTIQKVMTLPMSPEVSLAMKGNDPKK